MENQLTVCFLVDKDGTIKRVESEVPAVDVLCAQIASMPMRLREMQEHT